jgi:hypothetical protein
VGGSSTLVTMGGELLTTRSFGMGGVTGAHPVVRATRMKDIVALLMLLGSIGVLLLALYIPMAFLIGTLYEDDIDDIDDIELSDNVAEDSEDVADEPAALYVLPHHLLDRAREDALDDYTMVNQGRAAVVERGLFVRRKPSATIEPIHLIQKSSRLQPMTDEVWFIDRRHRPEFNKSEEQRRKKRTLKETRKSLKETMQKSTFVRPPRGWTELSRPRTRSVARAEVARVLPYRPIDKTR